jgi:hypothetical protein
LGTNYEALVEGRSAGLIVTLWNKPPKTAWFRVHPTHEVDVLMLDLSDKKPDALYFVDPEIAHRLITEPTASPRLLVQVQTSLGANALWAIKLGGLANDRTNTWTSSVIKAKELAKTRWIRLKSDQANKCYDPLISDAIDSEPAWPDVPFPTILEIALRDCHLATLNDPTLVELLTGKPRPKEPLEGDNPLLAGLRRR